MIEIFYLGHLSAVFCLLFDKTGNYVFTGADDLLVKVNFLIEYYLGIYTVYHRYRYRNISGSALPLSVISAPAPAVYCHLKLFCNSSRYQKKYVSMEGFSSS